MLVVGDAPCQCFSFGGIQTTSPPLISGTLPPNVCTRPQPETTNKVWPSGWVCQWVRAPGSKRTNPERTRAGAGASMIGSCQTIPVNDSAGPRRDGTEPLGRISMLLSPPQARPPAIFGFKVHAGCAGAKINEILSRYPALETVLKTHWWCRTGGRGILQRRYDG